MTLEANNEIPALQKSIRDSKITLNISQQQSLLKYLEPNPDLQKQVRNAFEQKGQLTSEQLIPLRDALNLRTKQALLKAVRETFKPKYSKNPDTRACVDTYEATLAHATSKADLEKMQYIDKILKDFQWPKDNSAFPTEAMKDLISRVITAIASFLEGLRIQPSNQPTIQDSLNRLKAKGYDTRRS